MLEAKLAGMDARERSVQAREAALSRDERDAALLKLNQDSKQAEIDQNIGRSRASPYLSVVVCEGKQPHVAGASSGCCRPTALLRLKVPCSEGA